MVFFLLTLNSLGVNFREVHFGLFWEEVMKTLAQKFKDINVTFSILHYLRYTLESFTASFLLLLLVNMIDPLPFSIATLVFAPLGACLLVSILAGINYYEIAKIESDLSLEYVEKRRVLKHKRFCRKLIKEKSMSHGFYGMFKVFLNFLRHLYS